MYGRKRITTNIIKTPHCSLFSSFVCLSPSKSAPGQSSVLLLKFLYFQSHITVEYQAIFFITLCVKLIKINGEFIVCFRLHRIPFCEGFREHCRWYLDTWEDFCSFYPVYCPKPKPEKFNFGVSAIV